VSSYRGPIIDVDIHHSPANDADVIKYLPRQWQDYLKGDGRGTMTLASPGALSGPLNESAIRLDAWAAGNRPGSSYEILRDQLLDKHGYHKAILTHQLGQESTHLNTYFARALCSAKNDWNADYWLSKDERIYSLLVLPLAEPSEAVKEVRRMGGHEKIVGILIGGNPLGKPIGDPLFHPIYEACADMGLAVSMHPTHSDRPNNTITAVGGSMAHEEAVSQFGQQAMHYISSLIVHGVFEKYPTLHFTFKEYGISWLPYLMMRLDQNYELLRYESPWVKKLPSDYIREHVKVSTQPIEESPDDENGVAKLLDTIDGMEDLLCFSSDYPHYSTDEPDFVARQLPAKWHRKVFCDNACVAFGWTPPGANETRREVGAATA
jgi:predicted TIM-barrel fold metal-dependent hydrolase